MPRHLALADNESLQVSFPVYSSSLTQISNTNFKRITVISLEAGKYKPFIGNNLKFYFIVVARNENVADTGEVRLYNFSTGLVVSGSLITVNSNVEATYTTEILIADLSLPLTVYEVQGRKVSGAKLSIFNAYLNIEYEG